MVRNEVRMMRTTKYKIPTKKLQAISLYWNFGKSVKDTQTKGVMCKWGLAKA